MPPRWRNGKNRRGDSTLNQKRLQHRIFHRLLRHHFAAAHSPLRCKPNPRRKHTPTSIISPGCRCSYLAPCPGLPSPTGLRPVYGTICFVPARYSGKHQTMLLCAQGMPTYGADAMNRIPTIKYSSVCV